MSRPDHFKSGIFKIKLKKEIWISLEEFEEYNPFQEFNKCLQYQIWFTENLSHTDSSRAEIPKLEEKKLTSQGEFALGNPV